MPMDEPSRGGFTISGRPRSSGTVRSRSRPWSSAGSHTQRGVGSCSAIHTRLVMVLSMAMAEAITPEPV